MFSESVECLSFPLSFLLAAIFVAGILLLTACGSKSRMFGLLATDLSVTCAVALPLSFAFLAVEGTFGLGLQHNPVFLILILFVMASLGTAVCNSVINHDRIDRILSHLGLFLLLFGGFFGAPDFREATMSVSKENQDCVGISSEGKHVVLPFSLRLIEFKTDYYPDGISPKQFTSTFESGLPLSPVCAVKQTDTSIATCPGAKDCLSSLNAPTYSYEVPERSGSSSGELTASVNHPCYHKGWLIYQSGYDSVNPDVSVLKLVRDPWLPIVLLGMLLLSVGSILSVRGVWKSKFVLPATLLLAAVFAFVSVARINLGTLMPALRSLWFVPHLIIYMIAYSVLAISLVTGIVSLFRTENAVLGKLSFGLLNTASSLLILGMLCGAVWAKFAWGDYWTWDSKECWAAATWVLTLVAVHLPNPLGRNRKLMVFVILLSFLAIQVTWYGVNYLPSSHESLHTYNLK